MSRNSTLLRLSVLTFIACAIWLIGLGGYFIFVRPPLLPEDLRYLHESAGQIAMHMPLLTSWLDKVFFVLGGFIAGGGCLLLFVAIHVLPQRLPGTSIALGCTGSCTVASMSYINFSLASDFRWLLLSVALTWLFGLVCFVAAGKKTAPPRL
jgi:hypothetical protein